MKKNSRQKRKTCESGVQNGVKQARLGEVSIRYLWVVAGGVTMMGLLMSSIVGTSDVSADTSAVDNVSITVPSACTLGGSITPGDEHTETIISGQYKQNIGKTTLTAYCNDQAGFVIYAAGSGGDGVGTANGTHLISNLGAANDIPTGINSGSATQSVWGMKLTAVTTDYTPTLATFATNADGYYAVPTNYTAVAWRDPADHGGDASTSTTVGSQVETTYMVSAKGTQPADTYVGKVSYAMLHPYTNSELISLQRAFQKAEKQTVTVDGKAYYKMQDMTTAICESVNIIGEASQVQLVDTRDYKLYYATKLEDGHCWMTQNLDLNLTTSGVYNPSTQQTVALTSDNTNLKVASGNGYSTGYSESGGVITYTPSMATTNSWEGSNRNNFSDWDNTDGIQQKTPKSWDTGLYYEDGTYFASSSCNYLAGTANPCARFSETPFTTNGTHGAVGNLYNFTQAIASNDSTNLASNTSGNPANNNPKNSICPKGWRLPYVSSQSGSVSGSTNEFARLNYLYNGDKTGGGLTNGDQGLFTAPLYFVRSGYAWSDALYYTANNGNYWSSTVNSGAGSYYLYFSSSLVYPANGNDRAYGFAVRCVAE